jgi:hypothetical protein
MGKTFSISSITTSIIIVSVVILLNQFMYLLPLHIGAFIVTITAVIIADLQAILWAMGKLPALKPQRLKVLHNVVSTGLLVSITSGFIMFLPLREYLVTVEAFWVKLAFVGVLIINSFVIARHMHIPTTRTFSSLSKKARRPLFLSGAASGVSWIVVFASALLLNV